MEEQIQEILDRFEAYIIQKNHVENFYDCGFSRTEEETKLAILNLINQK